MLARLRARPLNQPSDPAVLHWILRVAVAACFIRHGAFGIITPRGVGALLRDLRHPRGVGVAAHAGGGDRGHHGRRAGAGPADPRRAPLHGLLGLPDRLPPPARRTRAVGAPRAGGQLRRPAGLPDLARLGASGSDWFSTRPMPALTEPRAATIAWILRVTTALLLTGHGGFDFAMRKDWSGYAAAIGIGPATLARHPLTPARGLARVRPRAVLAWPARGLLFFVFAWKIGTETLRPLGGEPIWEFIEREGSYGALLALAWAPALTPSDPRPGSPARSARAARRRSRSPSDAGPPR